MNISVRAATGSGPTALAAFDAALLAGGIANFNLLRLSSVIPPATAIVDAARAERPDGAWGDRLYVVMAQQRAVTPGSEAWAGIGWVQDDSGRGLFVEHEGDSEAGVRGDVEATLTAMVEGRGGGFGPIQTRVSGITCRHAPVCALVCAVYRAEAWS